MIIGLFWFAGGLALFARIRGWLSRWFGWLLFVYGRASLSAYCLQAFLLIFIQAFVPVSTSPYYNFVLTVAMIGGLWALLRLEHVKRLLPT
jgi:hypothetical protein